MREKVIIVGAGINGLVAANYLSKVGFEVLHLEKKDQVGGACNAAIVATPDQEFIYPEGATILGLMPDFIFTETGLAQRLTTYLPSHPTVVNFDSLDRPAYLFKDLPQLKAELKDKWGETGNFEGFIQDRGKVIRFLQNSFRSGRTPSLEDSQGALGLRLTNLWITGSARNLLDQYLNSDYTKIYQALSVTESGPVSLDEPFSAFNIPLLSSGSVFGGYWGYVKGGLWQLPLTLNQINRELGISCYTGAEVKKVSSNRSVTYESNGETKAVKADHVIFATDPLSAALLLGDDHLQGRVLDKGLLGTSGKVVQVFRNPIVWQDLPTAESCDSALRFFINSSSLDEFERSTQSVVSGGVDFSQHHFQVYPDGVAMKRVGDPRNYEVVNIFFKDLAFGKEAHDLKVVKQFVDQLTLSRVRNYQDFIWSRLLTPKDMSNIFYFPRGNIDHIQLSSGQNFADRTFSTNPKLSFYQFGDNQNIHYCGAGAYPCGSVAGIPGYLCAQEIIRRSN